MEVETVVAVSLMMAVFSAVAAVGTSVVLGAGFERLRAGFDIISKQTGFFSDAIHKLEHKVEIVDKQTTNFTMSISALESKVTNVGEQANAFVACVETLEKKVEVVNKQSGFFSDSLYQLEKQIEAIGEHEQALSERMEDLADTPAYILAAADDDAVSSEVLTQMSLHASAPEFGPGPQYGPRDYGPDDAFNQLETTHYNISNENSLNSSHGQASDMPPGNGKAISYH